MIKPLLIAFILISSITFAQDVQSYYAAAQKAFKEKDYQKAYEQFTEAYKLYPYSSRLNYQRGLSAAAANHLQEALVSLKNAILSRSDFDLDGKEELSSLKGSKELAKLIELQKSLQAPIIHSDTGFVLKDRALHVESMTYDPATQSFYFSSIHKSKIVKVDKQKREVDFIPARDNGLTSVFGVKVDRQHRLLWASASPFPHMENYDSTLSSSAYKYELGTGKLLTVYKPNHSAKEFSLGDITLNSKGEAFVSDSKNNIIFKANESTHTLDLYFESPEFVSIQGISFSDNDQYLFIADYVKGIYRLDIKTKAMIRLEFSFDQSLAGVDGLTYYKNSLIAIQNGISPPRVTQYHLNATQDKLDRFTILDRNHPAFNEPTSGTLVGDQFYYIANSQWEGYDETNHIKPNDQLQDIVILHQQLRK